MEIRRNTYGKGKLKTITCISNDDGFRVASVILEGEKTCMIVDTQWTLSNAHRVIAEIYETGKPLTDIYLSHGHPDHYLGTQVFADAFPEATIWGVENTKEVIDREYMPKIEYWQTVVGRLNCPNKPITIKLVEDNVIMFEGNRIEIIPEVWGDMKWNTLVYIPSIKALIGSDVIFNKAHPFTCELTPKGRVGWINACKDILARDDLDIIIPGHAMPGMEFNESGPEYTIEYCEKTIENLAKTSDEHEFFHLMEKDFFDSDLRRSNEMNASIILGDRPWDWPDLEDHDEEHG